MSECGRAIVESFTLCGIEAVPVEVQVSVDSGYPIITLVGLPDAAVRESRERILAAFRASGWRVPDRRVTINLAPAELRKEGAAFDLPIALGILAASGDLSPGMLSGIAIAGELSLAGKVQPIRGALAMALSAVRAGRRALLLPAEQLSETREVSGLRLVGVRTLADAAAILSGQEPAPFEPDDPDPPPAAPACEAREPREVPDLIQVRGQLQARRALEIAAAGGHNLLFVGPPGAGKTLLAQCLPGILPSLSREEALEVALVQGAAGRSRPAGARPRERPFRAPHHTITGPGLVGGGAIPRPGEVSLAHNGVLFLDEVPEFRSHVLELLRQPLEEGEVTLSRAGRNIRLPCRFMLVGAMNPCPCGFLGHPRKPCACTPSQVKVYRNRLSGPLLDRIDLQVLVPAIPARELTRERATACERSEPVRQRVMTARERQVARFGPDSGVHANAQMTVVQLERVCELTPPLRAFLESVIEKLNLSARAVHRSLRVARTIADLARSDALALEHLAEAVQYRF